VGFKHLFVAHGVPPTSVAHQGVSEQGEDLTLSLSLPPSLPLSLSLLSGAAGRGVGWRGDEDREADARLAWELLVD
jgi:hypothetical protein